jgi:hypothetical protein
MCKEIIFYAYSNFQGINCIFYNPTYISLFVNDLNQYMMDRIMFYVCQTIFTESYILQFFSMYTFIYTLIFFIEAHYLIQLMGTARNCLKTMLIKAQRTCTAQFLTLDHLPFANLALTATLMFIWRIKKYIQ